MIAVAAVVGLLLLLGTLANDPDRSRAPRRAAPTAGRARVRDGARAGGARLRDRARGWRANTPAGRRLQTRTAAVRGVRGMFWPAGRPVVAHPGDGARVDLRKPSRTRAAPAQPARAAARTAPSGARTTNTAQFGGHVELLRLAQAGDALGAMELPEEGLTGLGPQLRALALALARVRAGLDEYVGAVDEDAQLDEKVMNPLWGAVDGLTDVAVQVAQPAKAEEVAYGAHHDAADSGLRVRPEFALPQPPSGARR